MISKIFGIDIVSFTLPVNESSGFINPFQEAQKFKTGFFAGGLSAARDLKKNMASILAFMR
jgi:hypothetical protein